MEKQIEEPNKKRRRTAQPSPDRVFRPEQIELKGKLQTLHTLENKGENSRSRGEASPKKVD